MKYLSTFVLSFCLFTLFLPAKASAQETSGANRPALPQQIIIKYKSGQSEDELMKLIGERYKRNNTGFFPAIKSVFSDLALKINGEETPELKLYRLLEAEKQAGVEFKKELFSEDANLKNYYQMKLKTAVGAGKALAILRNLPEVEFAESDWLSVGIEYK